MSLRGGREQLYPRGAKAHCFPPSLQYEDPKPAVEHQIWEEFENERVAVGGRPAGGEQEGGGHLSRTIRVAEAVPVEKATTIEIRLVRIVAL